MEPTIYKPGAYNTAGIYNAAGGIYNGRGVYKIGGGVAPEPPLPEGYTRYKYLENKDFSTSVIASFGGITLNWNDSFEICLEFPNGVNNDTQWFVIVTDWYAKTGARFSNYGDRAIQSAWNGDYAISPHITAPNNDYNDFLDENKQIRIFENKDKIIINGNEFTNTKGSEVSTLPINGTIQSANTCLSRFVELLVYDENLEIKEKLVPCKDPDGKSGLYKLFAESFVSNNTNFIAKD